jgi:hypothetical protein
VSAYEFSKDVQKLLHAKRFPLRVHYGPERTHREGYPENVIVFERDHGASDTLGPPRGQQRNPRKMRSRGLACLAHLYVKSSRAGARLGDHQDLCEQFVDALLAAMIAWAQTHRAEGFTVGEHRYLSAAERLTLGKEHAPGVEAAKIEQWPGVVYVVKFVLPRGLYDLDYSADGLPEATLEGLANRTDAFGPGGVGDPATGCGG